MKKIFKHIMYWHFFLQVKLLKLLKRPYVVLVVWVSQKSMIREKLKDEALKSWIKTRKKYMPYNTWFGVVLDFLDVPSAYSNIKWWIWIYFYSWYKFFKSLISFPDVLFLSGGVDEDWEAQKILRSISPDMIVFTDINTSFADDYTSMDVIEKEFWCFIDYLNKKSQKETLQYEYTWLDQIVEIINSDKKYIWVIDKDDERLVSLWKKLINRIFIKL